MLAWLLLILAPSAAPALEEGGAVDAERARFIQECLVEPLSREPLDDLSFFARQFNRVFGGVIDRNKRVSHWEKKVLKKHPDLALKLKSIGCRSSAIAAGVCGMDPFAKDFPAESNDEGSDAIRHFVLAFLLASAQGAEVARLYATAHETVSSNEIDRAIMDIANNEVGVELYEEMVAAGSEPQLSDRTLALIAINKLKEGKFKKLWPGNSRCSRPHEIPTDRRKIEFDIRQAYQKFRAQGGICANPLFPY